MRKSFRCDRGRKDRRLHRASKNIEQAVYVPNEGIERGESVEPEIWQPHADVNRLRCRTLNSGDRPI
jgi:hypothetical protein